MEVSEKTPLLFSSSDNDVDTVFTKDLRITPNRARIYIVTGLLLLAVMFERMTYHSILGNLVLFCTSDLGFSSTLAVSINLIFTAISYFAPILGGRIADTISGRFNTVYACFLIYLVGIFLLPVVSFDYEGYFGHDSNGVQYGLPMDYKRGYFLSGLLLVAVGAGGIKANISPLGAQQVEAIGENRVHSFFNWYYWFVNVGGCIAYVAVIYVQQEVGFFLGYIIPAFILVFALILFFIPRSVYYEHKKGSVVGEVIGILWQGTVRRCWSQKTANEKTSCLDGAKMSNGGEYSDIEVDHLKYVIKTIPIFLTLILFSAFTSQNTTTMLLQGERMNAKLGDSVIPVASLNVFKMAVIAFLIPVLDLIVYPLLNHFNKKPTMLQRIGFGMLMGVASLIYMAVLEILRKRDLEDNGGMMQNVGVFMYNASSISILWQVPQFVLTGVGETFTSITALEFAYVESPVVMQGMVMGINHLTTCLGSLLSTAIYNIIADASANSGQPWLPNDINNGYLEWFIFLLAGILFLNFLVFLLLAKWYKYCQLGAQQPLIDKSRKQRKSATYADSPASATLGDSPT